jgi:type VI secretion system protein ImpC
MTGRMNFDFSFSKPETDPAVRRANGEPKRILILGNFGGRLPGEPAAKPLAERTLHAIDLDTFDQALARLQPRIRLAPSEKDGALLEIEIGEIDDFHPDTMYSRLELFSSLRDLRKRLLDPKTFAQAAAELNPGGAGDESVAESVSEPQSQTKSETDGDTLSRLLGQNNNVDSESAESHTAAGGVISASGKVDITALIRDRIAPYIIPDADPRQDLYVESIDSAIRDQMRAILHHPDFQAVESAWRGLAWLVSELELDEELQLYICDVTREELAADLTASGDNLEQSAFYRLIVEKEIGTLGGRAWSLILGSYYFGSSDDDLSELAALGAIASRAGAPIITAATTELPANETHEHWQQLRHSPQARWLGLMRQRMLIRLPFGADTDEIDSFPFEELSSEPEHEGFLWANPVFACALVLGRAFLAGVTSPQPGQQVIENLPLYLYQGDDGKVIKPCAETLISEREGGKMLSAGAMPLLSYRDRSVVAVLRFQSVADPLAPLANL